jgi:hypothetical protein
MCRIDLADLVFTNVGNSVGKTNVKYLGSKVLFDL